MTTPSVLAYLQKTVSIDQAAWNKLVDQEASHLSRMYGLDIKGSLDKDGSALALYKVWAHPLEFLVFNGTKNVFYVRYGRTELRHNTPIGVVKLTPGASLPTRQVLPLIGVDTNRVITYGWGHRDTEDQGDGKVLYTDFKFIPDRRVEAACLTLGTTSYMAPVDVLDFI